MQGTIEYDGAKLREVASNMDNALTTLDTELKRFDSIVETLKTEWTGSDANTYINKAIEKRNAMTGINETLVLFPEMLRSLINYVEETEANAGNI